MKSAIPTLAIAACLFIAAGCSSQLKEFKDKKLVIASKETVQVKELDLSITNNGCGRKWVGGAEQPYCDILIKWKDSTISAGADFRPVYIGNIEITLDKMNPWGKEEDSVPPGGCRVWVKKLEGR
jgi:predicted membrane protein